MAENHKELEGYRPLYKEDLPKAKIEDIPQYQRKQKCSQEDDNA